MIFVIDGTRVDDVRVYDDEITPCLKSRMGTGGNNVPLVSYEAVYEPRSMGDENWAESTVKNALRAGASKSSHAVVQEIDMIQPPLAFSAGNSEKSYSIAITENATPPLRAGASGTNQVPTVAYDEPIAFWGKDHGADAGPISPTLRASNSVTANQTAGSCPAIASGMVVRRLTPVECERLMGWPDDHTLPRADGKTNSDTTRYKMCGNGVASPVAQWIGEQIMQAVNE